eukprot:2568678-Amphidinium_carterae.1
MRETHFRLRRPGKGLSAQDKVAWRGNAARMLACIEEQESVDAGSSQEKVPRKGKLQRTSAYDICHGLNWQLQMAGKGLASFLATKDDASPLHCRPHLSIISDTGADMYALVSYLLNKAKLRATFFPDPIHRVWRAVWNATVQCHLYQPALLAAVICNYNHGPFQSQAWYASLKETAKEYSALADENDPILQYCKAGLLKDDAYKGAAHAESECDVVEAAVQELTDPEWLQRKGERVATTRCLFFIRLHSFPKLSLPMKL